jgi:hypothetical protein
MLPPERYSSEPAEPEPRVAPVMPDGENSHGFFMGETKEDGVWKPMHKTAPNVALHYCELSRICKNPVNGCINLEPQSITEALAKVVVSCDGAI